MAGSPAAGFYSHFLKPARRAWATFHPTPNFTLSLSFPFCIPKALLEADGVQVINTVSKGTNLGAQVALQLHCPALPSTEAPAKCLPRWVSPRALLSQVNTVPEARKRLLSIMGGWRVHQGQ